MKETLQFLALALVCAALGNCNHDGNPHMRGDSSHMGMDGSHMGSAASMHSSPDSHSSHSSSASHRMQPGKY